MAVDIPDGYTLDAPDTSLPDGYTIDTPPPGFADREAADWARRNAETQGIKERAANGQPWTSTLFQKAGNLAGRTADLAGNVIGSGARYADQYLVPQAVDDAAIGAAHAVKTGTSKAGEYLANTSIGGDVAQGMASGQGAVSNYVANHPELSANLDAAGNILQVAPFAKPAMGAVGAVGSAVGDVSGAAGRAVLPNMGKGVADIARNATDAGLPLTVDQVAPNSAMGKGLNAMKILPLSGSNAPAFQGSLNKAVMNAAGMDSDVMTAPVLQARAKELGDQFKGYTNGKIFPSAPLKSNIPMVLNNVPKDVAGQLQQITEPLLAEAKLGPVSGDALDKARIASNELMRNSDDYGTKQAAGKLHDVIVNSIVGNDPAKAAEYKKLLGDYKSYKTVEDTYAQSKAGNVDPTAFQQAVMRNYGGDKALIDTPMGKLAKAATTYGAKPGLPWKVGKGVAGMLEAGALYHSPELGGAAMGVNRAIQYFVNRNPAIVKAIMDKTP